ncbi:MAG: type II secretion system protein GspL [Gammaproteobacteria bacterium]|nr:type II secretion system protein GspL [Gammaproteobacteria bacterium]
MQKITLYLNQDNQIQTYPATPLSDLKNHSNLYDIHVVVPSQTVLLSYAKLPKLNRHRLLQAIPFALEEQLLTDVHDLHFAIGTYQTDGIPVAIVTKKQMALWSTLLAEHDIKATVMLPESLAIPYAVDQWHILIHDDLAIVRTDFYNGFGCDKNNLAQMLLLKLNETTVKPAEIMIINYDDAELNLKINNINIIENNFSSQNFLKEMHAISDYPINLLQQQFEAKKSKIENKKIWRISSYLASAIIGLLFLSHIVSFFILHNQVTALDNAITKIYKHNFPLASSIIAPKQRMNDKLNNLQHQGNKNHLLVWLSYVGKSLKEASGIRLAQLDFHNNQLNIQITALNSNQLDTFTQSLTQQGLNVKLQDVSVENKSAKGTVIITESFKS